MIPRDLPDNSFEPASPASPARDAELAARIRLGDASAFEELFHGYYESLCAFVMSYVGASEAAEDVVQEMFARLWERRAEWNVRGSLRGYLYGAARNRALSQLRHAQIVARWRRRPQPMRCALAADEGVRADEFTRALARAVDSLSPRRRQAYTLRWQHDLSLAEIAAIMGVSVKCVELQLASASRTVRAALAEFFD